jgi:hypothetical protein
MYREAYTYVPQVLRWLLVTLCDLCNRFHIPPLHLGPCQQVPRRLRHQQRSSPFMCPLAQVLAGCAAQPQRFVEVRTVAEHLHVKVGRGRREVLASAAGS